jgi:hypothetical protein
VPHRLANCQIIEDFCKITTQEAAMPHVRVTYWLDPNTGEYTEEYEPDEEAEEADYQQHLAELFERELLSKEDTPEGPDPFEKLRAAVPILLGAESIQAKSREKIRYCWGVVVVQGTINMFAGGPGSGKSTLLFLLLAARLSVSPTELLGMPVAPAAQGQFVILIEGEHGESSTARKLLRALDTLDLPPSALNRLVVIARKAVTVGDKAWRAIEGLVAAGLVADIFLDTLARVSGNVDPNDEREQIKLFERLAKMIELSPDPHRQITLWIAAHTRKPETGKGVVLTIADISGSSQRTGQVDSLFGVAGNAKKPRTLCFLKLREEPDVFPDNIRYTYSNGELTIHPRVVKGEKPPAPAPVPSPKVPERILAALKSTPEKRWTHYAFKKHLGSVSGTVVSTTLETLCKRGLVESKERDGTTVYFLGKPKDNRP